MADDGLPPIGGPELPVRSDNVGGPRHYRGQGLGRPAAWHCPTCGTEHTTAFEAGCPVCLAEDARRETAIAGAVVGVEALAPYLLNPAHLNNAMSIHLAGLLIRGDDLSEVARQSMAAALAHYVEHGAPDATLLPKPVLIGWARELAGLGGDER